MRNAYVSVGKRPVSLVGLSLVLIVLTFTLQFRWTPRMEVMGPDSGMFAYGAGRLLSGQLLYRDFWDNKPPGVFYLDAVAMLLGGATPWAIWWLGLVWTTTTTVVLFLTLERVTGRLAAFAGTILFILTLMYPDYYMGGNFTEVYSLLPQVLCAAVAGKYLASEKERWIVVLGLLTAAIVLVKYTNVSIPVAAAAIIVYRDLRRVSWVRGGTHLLYFIAGTAIPLGAVIAYWASRGGAEELWRATVLDNLSYASGGLSILSIYTLIRSLLIVQPLSSLFILSTAGAAVFTAENAPWSRARQAANADVAGGAPSLEQADWHRWWLAGLILALPLEIAAIAASGKNFGHYYITPLPVLGVASSYLVMRVSQSVHGWRAAQPWSLMGAAALTLVVGAWCIEVVAKEAPRREYLVGLSHPLSGEYPLDEIEQFVTDESDPSQSILVWDHAPQIYFLTQRRAPSRFLFPPHILFAGSDTRQRFSEFMEDVQTDRPILILTRENSPHMIPSLLAANGESCSGCGPEATAGMAELREYVDQHYSSYGKIGEWFVLRIGAGEG